MAKKSTNTIKDEAGFINAEDATQEQTNAVLDFAYETFRSSVKTAADFIALAKLASLTNFAIPSESTSFIRALRRIIAEDIGISDRAMRNLVDKHGLQIIGDQATLAQVLVNKQRLKPETQAWVRSFYKNRTQTITC